MQNRLSHAMSPALVTGLAVVLAAGLAGCAGSSPAAGPASGTGSTGTGSTGGASSTGTPTGAPALELTVAGGKVTGDTGRVKVALGSIVKVTVHSDVADEVHSHVDDQHANVAAGGSVSLEVHADKPGIYEIELEGAKLPLVRLEVQ